MPDLLGEWIYWDIDGELTRTPVGDRDDILGRLVDDFSSGDIDAYTAVGGHTGPWDVEMGNPTSSGIYSLRGEWPSSANGAREIYSLDAGLNYPTRDEQIVVDVWPFSGGEIKFGLVDSATADRTNKYMLGFADMTTARVAKSSGGNFTELGTETVNASTDTWYEFHVSLSSDDMLALTIVDKATGDPMHTEIQVTDPELDLNGISLSLNSEGAAYFDNVRVVP